MYLEKGQGFLHIPITILWVRRLRLGRPGSLPRPTAVLEEDPEVTPWCPAEKAVGCWTGGLLAPQIGLGSKVQQEAPPIRLPQN